MKYKRYSTSPLPSDRFIPGVTALYKSPQVEKVVTQAGGRAVLPPERWAENKTYLYGVDLYNYAYWWESHEVFEALWKPLPGEHLSRTYFQGLIKVSAAFLKWHVKKRRGVELLFRGGMAHLVRVAEGHPVYMGLDLAKHIEKLEQRFATVLPPSGEWPDPFQKFPFIALDLLL